MLDATLGDPDGIQAASRSWDTLARWFVDCGDEYQESLKTVTNDIWHGEAADQYRQTAANTIAAPGVATVLAGPTFGASVAAFWAKFEVDADLKIALAILQIEQGLMHIAINTPRRSSRCRSSTSTRPSSRRRSAPRVCPDSVHVQLDRSTRARSCREEMPSLGGQPAGRGVATGPARLMWFGARPRARQPHRPRRSTA